MFLTAALSVLIITGDQLVVGQYQSELQIDPSLIRSQSQVVSRAAGQNYYGNPSRTRPDRGSEGLPIKLSVNHLTQSQNYQNLGGRAPIYRPTDSFERQTIYSPAVINPALFNRARGYSPQAVTSYNPQRQFGSPAAFNDARNQRYFEPSAPTVASNIQQEAQSTQPQGSSIAYGIPQGARSFRKAYRPVNNAYQQPVLQTVESFRSVYQPINNVQQQLVPQTTDPFGRSYQPVSAIQQQRQGASSVPTHQGDATQQQSKERYGSSDAAKALIGDFYDFYNTEVHDEGEKRAVSATEEKVSVDFESVTPQDGDVDNVIKRMDVSCNPVCRSVDVAIQFQQKVPTTVTIVTQANHDHDNCRFQGEDLDEAYFGISMYGCGTRERLSDDQSYGYGNVEYGNVLSLSIHDKDKVQEVRHYPISCAVSGYEQQKITEYVSKLISKGVNVSEAHLAIPNHCVHLKEIMNKLDPVGLGESCLLSMQCPGKSVCKRDRGVKRRHCLCDTGYEIRHGVCDKAPRNGDFCEANQDCSRSDGAAYYCNINANRCAISVPLGAKCFDNLECGTPVRYCHPVHEVCTCNPLLSAEACHTGRTAKK